MDREFEFAFGSFGGSQNRGDTDRYASTVDAKLALLRSQVESTADNLAGVRDGHIDRIAGHLFSTELLFDSAVSLGENIHTDVEFSCELHQESRIDNTISSCRHFSIPFICVSD